jgi:hypothetical protein
VSISALEGQTVVGSGSTHVVLASTCTRSTIQVVHPSPDDGSVGGSDFAQACSGGDLALPASCASPDLAQCTCAFAPSPVLCDDQDPKQQGCASDPLDIATRIAFVDRPGVGTVELHHSAPCQSKWTVARSTAGTVTIQTSIKTCRHTVPAPSYVYTWSWGNLVFSGGCNDPAQACATFNGTLVCVAEPNACP